MTPSLITQSQIDAYAAEKIEAVFQPEEKYLDKRFKHEYAAWYGMKQRCYNKKKKDYAYYGGRGIRVCPKWYFSFVHFLIDMGVRPEGRSLDRINNDGDYQPGNCRWATRFEQCSNQRSNRWITFRGETATLAQWSRKIGFRKLLIYERLFYLGWPVELALTVPPKYGHKIMHWVK